MKHLLYTHSRLRSLLGAHLALILGVVKLRLAPALYRLLPGRRGRRVASAVLLLISLVAQAFMLILLAELVDLCVSLYELWAFMAGEFVKARG